MLKQKHKSIIILTGFLATLPVFANSDVSNFSTSSNDSSTVVQPISIADQTTASKEYSKATFYYKDNINYIYETYSYKGVQDAGVEVGSFQITQCSAEDNNCSIILNTTNVTCNGSKYFKVEGTKLKRNTLEIDYEENKVLTVCYNVNSGIKENNNQSFDFIVKDVWDTNPAPTDINIDKFSTNKKIYINGACSLNNYDFGKITVTDPGNISEEGFDKDTHTFTTYGDNKDNFYIYNGNLKGSINFAQDETSSKLQKVIGVTATDSSDGIKDVDFNFIFSHNDSPTDISIDKTTTIGAQKVGVNIFNLKTIDFDGVNTCLTQNQTEHTYKIISQDGSLFKIVGSSLQFAYDFSNPTSDKNYSITIASKDGDNSFEKTFNLKLKANNDITDLYLSDDTYYGKINSDQIIARLMTSDKDISSTITSHEFSKDGSNTFDNAKLNNIALDGSLSFDKSQDISNGSKNWNFQLKVNDGDNTLSKKLTLTQYYEPDFNGLTLSNFDIKELESGKKIADILVPYDKSKYTYTFTGSSNDNSKFSINSNGEIKIGYNDLLNETRTYKLQIDVEYNDTNPETIEVIKKDENGDLVYGNGDPLTETIELKTIANKTFYLHQTANNIPDSIYIESMSENKGKLPEGHLLGTFRVIDDTLDSKITLTLLDGTEYVNIVKENGLYSMYTAKELPNTNTTYNLIVEINDGLNTKNFNIDIDTFQYFAPVEGISLNVGNNQEGITSKLVNGTYIFEVTDFIYDGLIDLVFQDSSGSSNVQFEPVSITLEGEFADLFEVDLETNKIKFKDGVVIKDGTYNLTIVTVSGGITTKTNITIIIDTSALPSITNIYTTNNTIYPDYTINPIISDLKADYSKSFNGNTTFSLLTEEDINNTIIPEANGIANISSLKDNDNQYFKIENGKLSILNSSITLPKEETLSISVKAISENGSMFIKKLVLNYFGAVITQKTYTSNDLKMVFSLGGHHLYTRYYQIDRPGIMEIADSIHTTYSKNANIRIPAQKTKVYNCTKQTEGVWKSFEENEIFHVEIETEEPLNTTLSGTIIIPSSDKLKKVSFGSERYWAKNDEMKITYDSSAIKLYKNGDLKETYDLISDSPNYTGNIFRTEWDSANKKLIVYKQLMRKISTGMGRSSPNQYDIYPATSGTNSGWDSCWTPMEDNVANYCTDMDGWIHTQYQETTTNIKLRSVDVPCVVYDFSDGNQYVGDTAVTESSFSHVVATDMSKDNFTINDVNYRATDWGTNIFATDTVSLDGIQLNTVGEIGSTILKINKVRVDLINSDDFTVGTSGLIDYNFSTIGQILTLNNLQIKATQNIGGFNTGDIITRKAGNYHMSLYYFMGDQLVMNDLFPLTIVSTNEIQTKGDPTVSKVDLIDIYADNKSKYKVCNEVQDNYGNSILGTFSGLNNDLISINTGIDARIFPGFEQAVSVDNIKIENSKICFELTSIAPGKFTTDFNVQFPEHELYDNVLKLYYRDLEIKSSDNIEFLQPVTGVLELSNCNDKDYPELNEACTYNIKLENIGGLTNVAGTMDFDLNIVKNSFTQLVEGHFWKSIGSVNNNIDINNGIYPNFKGLIAATDNTLKSPIIENVEGLAINYVLDNKNVSYKLDKFPIIGKGITSGTTDSSTINIDGIEENDNLGLTIDGEIQVGGNSEGSGFEENFTDIESSELRNDIRKNAYLAIKGLQPSKTKVYNGVLYYEGDLRYADIKSIDFETVIVKNGNFIINTNIDKFIGVVVLNDGYNVYEDYNKGGNIYVDSNVKYINAIMYSDGGLMSSNYGVLLDNSITRTDKLGNQLVIEGSLFSRNTIGGSLMIGGDYKLPGGERTNNYELALVYDLNYIRLGNAGCEKDTDGNCINDANFIVKYDPKVQIQTPEVFK